jgi:hypothetical protein
MREIRARECVQVLTAAGCTVRGVTPIRFVLSRADRELVFVPRHGPISRDELRGILTAAGVEEADFERMRCERDSRPSGFESVIPNDDLSHAARFRVRFDRVLDALGLRRSDARAS